MNEIKIPKLFNLDIDPREINDIAKDNQQIVNHILMIADSVRYVLGDNLKGIKGREVRKWEELINY